MNSPPKVSDTEVCRAVQEYQKQGNSRKGFADEILAVNTGMPLKVCRRAMERADARLLIEYGVSLRSAWLTNKGDELLQGDHEEDSQ